MDNMLAILVANGTAIMLLLILSISAPKNTRYGLFDEKVYYMMVIITFFQCIIETATFFIDGKMIPGYRELSIGLNSWLYINNILFAFTWTVYADYKLFENKQRLKKIYPFVFIPALIIIIGVIVNLFTPIFFTISAENIYQRTGAYIFPYACTYLYLLYGVVLVYSYRHKVKKYLFLPALVFMFPILIGSALQFFFYGLSLVWLSVAVALVSLYINVQNEASNVDTLSGLLTRQYLNNYLAAETKRMNPNKKMVGIMLDIDRFKSINDTFGHLTGDKAISSAGELLRSCVKENGFVARYAGDEFVMITHVKEESEILNLIQTIQDKTEKFNQTGNEPYKISFSIGYSVFQFGKDTVDTFFNAIDSAMYEDKRLKIQEHILPERRENRE